MADLAKIYRARFEGAEADRARVWEALTQGHFQRYVSPDAAVLDVGCGWGHFINTVKARRRCAIDLNPDVRARLAPEVEFFQQSCAERWPVEDGSLDTVFTSNFLEHLPTRLAISLTVQQALRCLKPGGRLVCIGPNIRYVPGRYWDFFDHNIPLTERSLSECLVNEGFTVERATARFLPYTMSGSTPPPSFMIRAYLAMPFAWPLFGKQFLVVARKP